MSDPFATESCGHRVLAGLNAIDWVSLEHAYGSAKEVPDLLRGLVSEDPQRREACLDGYYGAVHHQGDIYDSTLATIPFLLRIVEAGLPGLAQVLGLLASLGSADSDTLDHERRGQAEGDQEMIAWSANYRRARDEISAAGPLFERLVADPDPAVRGEAANALLVRRTGATGTLRILRERFAIEDDPTVRGVLLATAAALARRATVETGDGPGGRPAVDRAEVSAWLMGIANGPGRPPVGSATREEDASESLVRLSALIAALGCGPDVCRSENPRRRAASAHRSSSAGMRAFPPGFPRRPRHRAPHPAGPGPAARGAPPAGDHRPSTAPFRLQKGMPLITVRWSRHRPPRGGPAGTTDE
ncbi:MAG: HEAT repeat domain-containing protein [Dactylosporangium sp.]|nr:HEAT repeat domain-containing protein [Dactylosporangium sp.]